MGFMRWEERAYAGLLDERRGNIDVVISAYESLNTGKAYMTMPITSGKRLYDVMWSYGAANYEEFQLWAPEALRAEVILPNIEAGLEFARTLQPKLPLIIPGVFEARKQRWSQDEYMIMWLKVFTGQVREFHLLPDWEYSNGGVMEFVRAMMIQFRFIDQRETPISIYDHQGNRLYYTQGAQKIVAAIQSIEQRRYDAGKLRNEFRRLASIQHWLDWSCRDEYRHHVEFESINSNYVREAASTLGINFNGAEVPCLN